MFDTKSVQKCFKLVSVVALEHFRNSPTSVQVLHDLDGGGRCHRTGCGYFRPFRMLTLYDNENSLAVRCRLHLAEYVDLDSLPWFLRYRLNRWLCRLGWFLTHSSWFTFWWDLRCVDRCRATIHWFATTLLSSHEAAIFNTFSCNVSGITACVSTWYTYVVEHEKFVFESEVGFYVRRWAFNGPTVLYEVTNVRHLGILGRNDFQLGCGNKVIQRNFHDAVICYRFT